LKNFIKSSEFDLSS